jgi:hypothetical protein
MSHKLARNPSADTDFANIANMGASTTHGTTLNPIQEEEEVLDPDFVDGCKRIKQMMYAHFDASGQSDLFYVFITL